MNFKDLPNLRLHGSTWDAQHLDSFLKSSWARDKFRKPETANTHKSGQTIPRFYMEEKDVLNNQPKHLVEIQQVSNQLKDIKDKLCEGENNLNHRITPTMRKKLTESTNNLHKKYKLLKNKRMDLVKRERLHRNSRCRSREKTISLSKAEIIEKTRKTSNDIYFGYSNDKPPTRGTHNPNRLKSDSYSNLFSLEKPRINVHRNQRLRELWRGSYDIISGVNFKY